MMRLLVVGAHPDDCEIGAGGLIAREESLMLSVTNGANDSRSWNLARQEMAAAAEALGCRFLIWDYPTDVHCSAQLVAQLDEVIRENEIDTVVTHFTEDTNQTHREVAEAVVSACRRTPTVLMMEPSPPAGRSWHPFRPQLYVDITPTHQRKMKALEAYSSQVAKYGDRWMVGVQTREVVRGWEAGVERAEAYEVLRILL